MSKSSSFLALLRSRLPQPLWAVVLPALHHDPIIWQTAREIAADLLATPQSTQASAWSPAGLALHLLGAPFPPESLAQELERPLPAELQQQASRAFQWFLSEPATEPDLTTAGLLALALRERRRLTGKWEGLPADLQPHPLQTWQRPLACLLGIIPDRADLLIALCPASNDTDLPKLLIDVLLCQPLAFDDLKSLFAAVLPAMPSPQQQYLLETLAHLRRPLAQALAREMAGQSLAEDDEASLTLRALIHRLTDEDDRAQQLLSRAWDATRRHEAALIAQLAETAMQQGDLTTALTAWEQATQLAPDRPLYLVRRVQALLQAGHPEQAQQLLPTDRVEQPWFAVAWAELAAFHGDLDVLRKAIASTRALPLDEVPTDLLYQLAKHAALISDYATCDHYATAITQRDPQHQAAWRLLSHARFKSGDLEGAIEAAHFGITLDPDNRELRRQLAGLLEAHKDWDTALQEWQHLAKAQPNDLEALYGVARCALHADQPETALIAAQAWLEQEPDQVRAHILAGQALMQLGDSAQAGIHFQQATALQPDDPQVWLAAARAQRRSGDQKGAIETLRAAAVAVPYAAEVHLELGEAWLEDGQPSQALSSLEVAQHLFERLPQPSSTLTHRLTLAKARALTSLGRHSEAHQVLEPVYQSAPEEVDLAVAFAHIALIEGHPEEALQALKPIIHHAEAPPSAFLDYARAALECQVDPQAVIAVLDRLLRKGNPPSEALYWKAEALRRSGRAQDAIPLYRQALDRAPDHHPDRQAPILLGLARALLAVEKHQAAIPLLERAAEQNPNHLETLHTLAEAYRDAGDRDAATRWAQHAREVAPSDVENLCWFAALSRSLEQPKAAVQALVQATQRAPDRADLWLELAAISPEHAWEACHHVATLETATAEELHAAARRLLTLSDPDGALRAIQRALDIAESPELLRTMAEIHLKKGDRDAALQALERARRLAPSDSALLLWQADLLLEADRAQEARRCLEQALQIHDQPEVIHQRLTEILMDQGDLPAALEHAKERLRLESSLEARLQVAELHYALLQDAEALSTLTPALEGDADTELQAFCLLGECHLNFNAEVAAAEALTQARKRQPDHPRALSLLTRILCRRGDIEGATAAYARIPVDERLDPSTRLALALAARELEDWETALSIMENLTQSLAWPRFALELSRTLVERAEVRVVSQDLDIQKHTPPASALAESVARAFEKTILQAGRQVQVSERDPRHPVLLWYARGQAVWHPSPEHAQALARFADQPEMLAAYLAALRRAGQVASSVEAAATVLSRLKDQLHHAPPKLLLQLALTLRRDQPEIALKLAQQAAHHPNASPREQAALALLARQNGQTDVAISAWQAALHAWPDEPRWHHHLARLYLEQRPLNQEALQQAATHLERALTFGADDLATRLLLAQTWIQIGQPGQALEILTELQQQAPEHSGVWLALARAHLTLGDLEQASNCARAVHQHHPQPSEARAAALLQARIALQAGEPAKAVAFARKAQKDLPTTEGQVLLAKALAALGQYEEALQAIDAVFDPHQAPFEAALERARLLEQLHGPAATLAAWEELATRFPDRLEAVLPRAHALAAADQVSAAIQAARDALSLAHEQSASEHTLSEIHRLLGKLHHREGQLDLALTHLTTALKLEPDDVQSYLALADVYEARREPALAADVLHQAIALQPDNAPLHYRLGTLLKDLGDLDAAEHMFRQAAQLDPHNLTYRHQWAAVLSARTLQRSTPPEVS